MNLLRLSVILTFEWMPYNDHSWIYRFQISVDRFSILSQLRLIWISFYETEIYILSVIYYYFFNFISGWSNRLEDFECDEQIYGIGVFFTIFVIIFFALYYFFWRVDFWSSEVSMLLVQEMNFMTRWNINCSYWAISEKLSVCES